MQPELNPQELLDLALFVSMVLTILVLVLLAAYLRHRSARVRAERAMDRSESYLEAILDAAVPGIIVVTQDGVVDAFNLAAERMFGYGAFEIIGRKISTYKLFAAHAGNGGESTDPFGSAISSTANGAVGVQALGCRRNGTTFPAELFVSEGRVGHRSILVGVVQDLTARNKAEEAVREDTAQAEAVLDSIEAIVLLLDADGKVRHINRAGRQATGYSPEEVQGSFFWDLFPVQADAAKTREHMGEAAGRDVPRNFESDWLTKDHRIRRIVWRLAWLPGGEGPARRLIIAGTDITDHVQRSEQAAVARVTAALEGFADAVALRLTDPLTAASGYAELVLACMAKDDAARKDIAEIQQATAKAAALARDLQAYGRGQILVPRLVDVNAVLTGMEGSLRRMLGGGIGLEYMLAPAIGRVRIDPEGLARAIERLAGFMAERLGGAGRIVIRTLEVQGGPGAVCVMVAVVAPDLEMLPEVCERSFRPFAAESFAGDETGLAMAAVHGFLRQSGADVHATSRPGSGTRLEVYLPRIDPAPQSRTSAIYSKAED
ncbi:MAG: PAS domain S-box protein [Acidobacteriales bacterium]|nr:PAS domain S-box protein [Terriglobales bacterium]